MKRLLLLVFAIFITTGCLPKRGEIHPLPEQAFPASAEITLMRNGNLLGSGVRFYPTVNGKRVAGLFINEHINFQLSEGTYVFGVEGPIYGVEPLYSDQIEKKVQSSKQYFFLLSRKFPIGIEIEETDKGDASNRLKDSTHVSTGEVSESPGFILNILRAPFEATGLAE